MVTTSPIHSVLDRMVTLSRAMDPSLAPSKHGGATPAWSPAIDAFETEQAWIITADLPGVPKDKVEVSFDRNTLTLKGERPSIGASNAETSRVFFAERAWGTFQRAVRFPQHVDGDRISAAFTDGVLTVTVPKSESAKARMIEVR
ncbi:MAG: Hsp20/alpha crystallin family protein [Cytophagaceae bacterium]|nr:Hsp20/alpha crystallin family protein [Gemmatimonadaceae bacterium]